jgi:hypothetical protein
MVDKESFFRLPLYRPCHPLAVARPEHKRLQYQQVQCPLQQGDAVIGVLLGSHPT